MTNEKAIEVIRENCYVFNPMNLDRTTLVNTALDTAIKALEGADLDGYSSRLWKVAYERGKLEAEQGWNLKNKIKEMIEYYAGVVETLEEDRKNDIVSMSNVYRAAEIGVYESLIKDLKEIMAESEEV